MIEVVSNAALVVPTLNGGALWRSWLERFREQTVRPQQLLVIDSSSDDETPELAKAAGFEVITIEREQFDHGGTRQFALGRIAAAKNVVFMTQDALLANPLSMERLLGALEDERVGAAYGRQLPRTAAGHIEAHARLFNYPSTSHRRSLDDAPKFGFKTAFLSNSFAAYRLSALTAIGGFKEELILGEDTCAALGLLAAGWHIAYCAETEVCHSHDYSWLQIFRRYFDIGVLHAQESWMFDLVGSANGEGVRFIASELEYLARHAPLQIPRALVHSAAKLVAYRLGRKELLFPLWAKERLSMSRSYWSKKRRL